MGWGSQQWGQVSWGASNPGGADENPPEIENLLPTADATDVEVSTASFSLTDDFYIEPTSIVVTIDGVIAYQNQQFTAAFSASTLIVQSSTQYDFVFVPQAAWTAGSEILVNVYAEDTLNTLDTTYSFVMAEDETANPFSMYRMLIGGMRSMDRRSPGTLQKILQGFEGESNGLDQIWSDLILDRSEALSTLFDPDEIDDKWLPWLKSIVGFTRDVTFSASEDELRRVIKNAVLLWNAKPSKLSIERAIRMVTGNRFRHRNYFQLRMQADQTVVTEELEDFDPNVLDFGQDIPYGSQLTVTASDTFSIADLPGDLGIYGFQSDDQFLFLQILDGPNSGTYDLLDLTVSGSTGRIKDTFGTSPDATNRSWRLIGEAGDFTTEIRLVDESFGELDVRDFTTAPSVGDQIDGVDSKAKGEVYQITVGSLGPSDTATIELRNIQGRFLSGESLNVNASTTSMTAASTLRGVINLNLVTFLLDLCRPVGERFDVVLVDFIDRFLVKGDTEQWTEGHLSAGTPDITVTEGTGYAEAAAGSFLFSGVEGNFMDDWKDQSTAWKVQASAASTVIRGFFYAQNDELDDSYLWELDYDAQELKLYKRVAGVDAQIGSTVALPFLVQDDQNTVRVDALAESGSTRIRVKVDGEKYLDELDGEFEKGHTGFATISGTGRLLFTEVNTIPTTILRVGPR